MIPIRWVPREQPLAPEAVWIPDARGQAAAWVMDPRRSGWRGLASGRGLLLIGADLPWAARAVWLGTDPDAPDLLVPTRLRPDTSPDLVARALMRAFPDALLPLAVLPTQGLVLPAGAAARLDPTRLGDWADRP